MSLVAIAMVLGAAVLHAAWNLLAKKSADVLSFLWAISVASLVLYALPFFYVVRNEPIEWNWVRFAIISGVLHVAYYALLALAYERSDLSFAYPVARGTGMLLVPLLAVPIFGDRPTVMAWIGIGLVIAGMLWLHRPLFAAALNRGDVSTLISIPALLTGLVIASYSLNDTAGVHRTHPIVYVYSLEAFTVLLMAPYMIMKRWDSVRAAFGHRRPLILGGFGSAGTYAIVLTATRLAPVSYVVPMRETSIVIGAVLGARVLGESLGSTRLAACILVVVGVIAIGIGG